MATMASNPSAQAKARDHVRNYLASAEQSANQVGNIDTPAGHEPQKIADRGAFAWHFGHMMDQIQKRYDPRQDSHINGGMGSGAAIYMMVAEFTQDALAKEIASELHNGGQRLGFLTYADGQGGTAKLQIDKSPCTTSDFRSLASKVGLNAGY